MGLMGPKESGIAGTGEQRQGPENLRKAPALLVLRVLAGALH